MFGELMAIRFRFRFSFFRKNLSILPRVAFFVYRVLKGPGGVHTGGGVLGEAQGFRLGRLGNLREHWGRLGNMLPLDPPLDDPVICGRYRFFSS